VNKLLIHTVEQPDSDITTFVLSCNRLEVLDRTLKSFLTTRDCETRMVIVDDSATEGVFETLVERYGEFSDVICFPRNRSQWWAMDFMVSYCDSDYIFYLEDDWELIQPGYLTLSKQILEKYRNVGTVDISWRTFEWQELDSYEKELIDNTFYWKKYWRITDYHLGWYAWCGSPNLKRRDDLILLGRVEKWHNEWNIDRRFRALGFRGVFLNGEYARHLGDNCSTMAGKRPNDGTTPEDYYPLELQSERVWPKFDYMFLDKHWRHPNDISVVTTAIDLGRGDRDFETHYMGSLARILQSRHPIILYGEERYFAKIKELRGNRGPLDLIKFDKSDLEAQPFFDPIKRIVESTEWVNQSSWMKDSVISDPYYIPLTLMKHHFMLHTTQMSGSSYYYWVDAGMYSSYNVPNDMDTYYFTKIPKDRFFMTSFPYLTDSEVHGYDIDKLSARAGGQPGYVCRATLYGGTREQIVKLAKLFYDEVNVAINLGTIGAEESIYTILCARHPELFTRHNMPNGDINNYLNLIKG